MDPRKWTLAVYPRMYTGCTRRLEGSSSFSSFSSSPSTVSSLSLVTSVYLSLLLSVNWTRVTRLDARIFRRAVSLSGGRAGNCPTIVSPDGPAGELQNFSESIDRFSSPCSLFFRSVASVARLGSEDRVFSPGFKLRVEECPTRVRCTLSWLAFAQTTEPRNRGVRFVLTSDAVCTMFVEGQVFRLHVLMHVEATLKALRQGQSA